ncbi:GntR family transcriptional regulator [Streptomyces roseoverticillatus]|uniref:GntR family transcriptional regulator n=1 Tax=Streptomyces roseoverticillatus TaxID=66429 RepID=UPI001F27AB70|nr:GntR family transcriptional regulator [Streptomyces roseoverticillatus]MCF3102430.1 GntR family transcriptional regulator [Streptomyces roseoverticillatus]
MEQGRSHAAPPAARLFAEAPAQVARGAAVRGGAPAGSRGGGPAEVHGEGARGEHVHGEQEYGVSCAAPAHAPARRMPQRHSVRGQILDALRKALVSGELIPGEVYSGPALGERFGVSATPVREAMQQLALEGAVEVVPNRGFRVATRTARDLAELAEVRALLEVPVLLRLARTVPAAGWDGLRPLAETASAAAATGDRALYAEADRAFHRALLGLAGNRQLVAVADELHRRAQWPAAHGRPHCTADLVADAAEHVALLEALAAHDGDRAEALVRGHFAGAG